MFGRAARIFGWRAIYAAGLTAGVAFAVFQMLASALLAGPDGLWMPLRMIGAILLGSRALDPQFPLAAAAMAGVGLHLVLSVEFAAVFAAIASRMRSPAAVRLTGIGFGMLLWLINFYVIAPPGAWIWFPDRSNPVVQFLAHAFFFGAPVGWFIGRSRAIGAPPVPAIEGWRPGTTLGNPSAA